jgi:hypothetical protein
MQAYLHFCNDHLFHCLEMIGRLDPGGPPAPCLDGVLLTWSPEMRGTDWSDQEAIRRLGIPELVEHYLGRSLSLLDEFIEMTARALEAPTDPAVLQVQLWTAVARWKDALSQPLRSREKVGARPI